MSEKPELTFEERVLSQTFDELLIAMREVGLNAPAGTVLNHMEGMVLDRGRDLLRRTMESQLQAAVDAAEKKTNFAPNAKKRPATKGRVPKQY